MGARILNRIRVEREDDPRLEPFRDLKDSARTRAPEHPHGAFVAEGFEVVRCLLSSRFRVGAILATPACADRIESVAGGRAADTPVLVADIGVLERTAGFQFHHGILAVGLREPPLSGAELAGEATSLLVLEDLRNHDNVGGLFRVAAALGGARPALLLSPRCCDPLYRKSIRVSMGHALTVPFARLDDWPGGIRALEEHGYTTVALTPRPDAREFRSLEWPAGVRPAIVVGTEGHGLSDAAATACREMARIPMRAGMDSLNVFVAAGIALAGVPGLTDAGMNPDGPMGV